MQLNMAGYKNEQNIYRHVQLPYEVYGLSWRGAVKTSHRILILVVWKPCYLVPETERGYKTTTTGLELWTLEQGFELWNEFLKVIMSGTWF